MFHYELYRQYASVINTERQLKEVKVQHISHHEISQLTVEIWLITILN